MHFAMMMMMVDGMDASANVIKVFMFWDHQDINSPTCTKTTVL